MANDRKHRNYNEENDLTSAKKTKYIKCHILIAHFVKIAELTTGIFSALQSEEASKLDHRDIRKIKFSIQVILTVCLLSNCLGISVAQNMQATSIFPSAISNVNYLTGENLDVIPNYETINHALSGITDVSWFEDIAQTMFEKLERSGRYKRRRKGGAKKKQWMMPGIRVILDATDYAFFRSAHCDHDLTATFHKGTAEEKTYYYHKALVAYAVIAPHLLVPIGIEFIKNKDADATSKQDCENAAALRVMARIKRRFPKMHFVMCGDALYANKTFIGKCKEYNWDYLFTLRQGVQPSLYEDFEFQKKDGELQSAKIKYGANETGTLYWSGDLGSIVESDLQMYILEYTTSMAIRGKSKGGNGSVALHQKDFTMDMPELSKNFGKFDLDGKIHSKKQKSKARKRAQKEEQSSEKIKEAVAKVNQNQAADLQDAVVHAESKDLKEGDLLEVTFMYITSIPITEENCCTLLVQGRDRWSIEEAFRNAKLGPLQIEHLRTLNANAMEVCFWMEQLAETIMQLYLYHSDILKIAGSQKEVCELLRNSFENQSLESSRDFLSSRVCLWPRDEAHHQYPDAKILSEGTPLTIKAGKKAASKTSKGNIQKSQPEKAAKEAGKISSTEPMTLKGRKEASETKAEKAVGESKKATSDPEKENDSESKCEVNKEESVDPSGIIDSAKTAKPEETTKKVEPTLARQDTEKAPQQKEGKPCQPKPNECQGGGNSWRDNPVAITGKSRRPIKRMRLNPARRRNVQVPACHWAEMPQSKSGGSMTQGEVSFPPADTKATLNV